MEPNAYAEAERVRIEIAINDACGHVSTHMARAGYVAVWEHVVPAILGRTVYTLWLNLRTGEMQMSIVDAKGEMSRYLLVPA